MKPLHKIALVCTTFLLAAATGHVMQNSAQVGLDGLTAPQDAAKNLAPEGPAPSAQAQAVLVRDDLPEMRLALGDQAAPALDLPPMRVPGQNSVPSALPQDSTEAGSGFAAPACPAPQISAEPAPSASVRITVNAPCQSSPEAEIRHEGLRLPILLSAEGHWSGIVPAMAKEAVFALGLVDTPLPPVVSVRVPDLATVNRIAVGAGPVRGFALHGYEYNATPGGMGDVSAMAPRDPATDLGGWMVSFDTPQAKIPMQIYTAPATMADISLALEVPVTPDSCGKDMVGVAARLVGGVTDEALWTLAMPDCGDGNGAVMMSLPEFPVSVAAAD